MRDKTYSILTFGCQMNELDSQIIAGHLESAGFSPAHDRSSAGLIILNTCSVRAKAQHRATSILCELTRDGRGAGLVGVMGCVAQQMKGALLDPPFNADFALGIGAIAQLDQIIDRLVSGERRILVCETGGPHQDYDAAFVRRPHSKSAYVAISRGCSNFCSYCIVPFVRGPLRHRTPKTIINEVRLLVDAGCIDICLIGQNVNNYRQGEVGFSHLLHDVAQIAGIRRLRFITTQPKDLCIDTVKMMAKPPFAPYISMPLQSGSDRILRLMNRGYTRSDYLDRVSWLRELVPGVAISTDVMVGFPGETEADFEDTLEIVRLAQFENVYSFMYSSRPFTRAVGFPDEAPADVKKRRFERLLGLQHQIQLDRMLSFEGKTVEVLVDGPSKRDRDVPCGRSRQNIVVNLPHDKCSVGDLVLARIEKAGAHCLIGRVTQRL